MPRRRFFASPGRFALAAVAVATLCPASGLAAPAATLVYAPADLRSPGGTPFQPTGINASGDIVGLILTKEGKVHVAIYHRAMEFFTDLYPAAPEGSDPVAINDWGDVLVAYRAADGMTHTLLFTNGMVRDLGVIRPVGFNNRGHVIASRDDKSGPHAIIVRDGMTTPLSNLPGGTYFLPLGINLSDEVVGEADDKMGMGQAVSWKAGTTTPLNVPASGPSMVTFINNASDVVGSYSAKPGYSAAFKITDNDSPAPKDRVFLDLNPSDASNSVAFAINDAGITYGTAVPLAAGAPYAFSVVPNGVPTPLPGLAGLIAANSAGQIIGSDSLGSPRLLTPIGGPTLTPATMSQAIVKLDGLIADVTKDGLTAGGSERFEEQYVVILYLTAAKSHLMGGEPVCAANLLTSILHVLDPDFSPNLLQRIQQINTDVGGTNP